MDPAAVPVAPQGQEADGRPAPPASGGAPRRAGRAGVVRGPSLRTSGMAAGRVALDTCSPVRLPPRARADGLRAR
eukprot:11190997-Lingulodinium_polyedra.AAC.1